MFNIAVLVPLFDASVDGFDIGSPFSEIRNLPSMQAEAPSGSIGAVFYTVSDTGSFTPIDFNVQAFGYIATLPESTSST